MKRAQARTQKWRGSCPLVRKNNSVHRSLKLAQLYQLTFIMQGPEAVAAQAGLHTKQLLALSAKRDAS
jgi:hypothetical protein